MDTLILLLLPAGAAVAVDVVYCVFVQRMFFIVLCEKKISWREGALK